MRVILLLLVLCAAIALPGQRLTTAETPAVEAGAPAEHTLPAAAQAVLDRFVGNGAQLQRDADTKVDAARAKLVAALEAIQASESKAGRLESALAVKTLRDGFAANTVDDLAKATAAPDLPKAIVRPTDVYQSEQQKIARDLAQKLTSLRDQTVKELEAVKVSETKAGRLDVALLIKQQQEQLRTGQVPARGSKGPAKVLTFGKGATLVPGDRALLRKGGAAMTIEFLIWSKTADGTVFQCGAMGNGMSVALVGDEAWFAIAGGRREILVKAPLAGAKAPLHVAVGFDKGEVQMWVNGALAKRDSVGMEAIGDNFAGGGIGQPETVGNNPAMPRHGYEGDLVAFRLSDRVVYNAPFTPTYPLPGSEAVRLLLDAGALTPGPLSEVAGPQRLTAVGELQVRTR